MIIQKSQVDTIVLINRFLPVQVVISPSRNNRTNPKRIREIGRILVHIHGNIGIKILVTGITDREAQFQIIQPVLILKKPFLVNIPSDSDRPCRCELLGQTEHGRTVRTKIYIQQVPIVISITRIQVITNGTFLARGVRRFCPTRITR